MIRALRRLRAAGCLVLVLALPAYADNAPPTANALPTANAQPAANPIDPAEQLQAYMLAASAFLGAEQLVALSKITDEDRRHLAMASYLRVGSSVASRWSWSSEQIQAYEKSPEYAAVLAEIERIAARFSTDNPEYLLHANTQIRSLEDQLLQWQSLRSVGETASELRDAALATLVQQSYGREPDDASVQRFREFLGTWRASRPPTITAPGLSLHGRGRAYDFQISDKAGRVVADTDASAIGPTWEDQGWAEKLSNAVQAASSRFRGPLRKPYEPWHYEYEPAP